MTDIPDTEKNNLVNNSLTNSNEHLKVPPQINKPEEVEMETKPEHTKLDLEDSNLLHPEISPIREPIDRSSRRASWASVRKHSMRAEEPLGIPPNADVYYDDYDWITDEDEDDDAPMQRRGVLAVVVYGVQRAILAMLRAVNHLVRGHLLMVILLLGYIAYFVIAMNYEFGEEPSIRLLVCTILGVLIWIRKYIFQLCFFVFVKLNGGPRLSPRAVWTIGKIRLIIRWLLYVALAASIVYVVVDQGRKSMTNLRSLPGLAAFLIICLFFSTSPGNINWHTIYWSIGLQFLCALFVLRWDTGKDTILWIQDRLDEFFANSKEGSKFVFGEKYAEHYLVFGAFPVIFLSNATLVALYYLGAMQLVIRVLGSFLSFVLDASPIESMSVAAGIFMEGVIAILTLKPYLGSLTRSQLFLVLTSVFSSLGGAYMAILASLGVSLSHIIPAMLVSAPATFAVCKLMVPESKKKRIDYSDFNWDTGTSSQREKYTNIMDAIQDGAMSMLSLIGNMLAVAFVFVCYIYWVNNTLEWFGDRVGIEDLSIELIFSYLLFPVSLAMGIEWDDCRRVAMLLGYRIGSNNIVAFMKLTEWKIQKGQYFQYMMATNYTGPVTNDGDDITLVNWNTTLKNGFLSERSETIVTYCLCGFSSFITVTITIGIMYTLLPRRRAWLGSVAWAALIAGNIANCMTGCFASLFY